MSHEIREHDEQQGRTQAWHGLTTVVPNLSINSPELYLRQWDVSVVGCRFVDKKTGRLIARPGETWESLIVADTRPGHVLNPETAKEAGGECLFVSPPYVGGKDASYVPFSNAQFIDLVANSLKSAGLPGDVESNGSVFNRRRTFISVPIPDGTAVVGAREFKFYLNFLNSFDQSVPVFVNLSNICTVCNNTLSMNLGIGGLSVRHTANMPGRIERIPAAIGKALELKAAFANDFLKLESAEIAETDAKSLFAHWILGGSLLSTQAVNKVDRLTFLFKSGPGNSGKTLADVFSAITDYYSHESTGGKGENKAKQFTSSEFGDGAATKRAAFGYLLGLQDDTAEFEKTVAAGAKLIAEYHAS